MRRAVSHQPKLMSALARKDAAGGRSLLSMITFFTVMLAGLVVITSARAQFDFGDAPLPYPTILNNGAALHIIREGLSLGPTIDAEPDGQPGVAADGDDLNPIGSASDEDGVTFLDSIVPGQVVRVRVDATQDGILNAWLDMQGDGSWNEAQDQIFANQPLAPGGNPLQFIVPATARVGQSYSRFRFNQKGDLGPGGRADDGEVEDYRVNITQTADFGDAPDGYPVTLTANGARHLADPKFTLGSEIDTESDGQHSQLADGDDTNPSAGPDDEDGVTFASSFLQPGATVTVRVVSSLDGRLDAWIDFDRNQSWSEPNDQIFTSVNLVPGNNDLTFVVPDDVSVGRTAARFRLSSEGNLGPMGPAPDGEVEDYLIDLVKDLDFGDAPDSYRTLAGSNGAAHSIEEGFFLGASVDGESDGVPGIQAIGDDSNPSSGPDDEDGVTFSGPLYPGQTYSVVVVASLKGQLDAWVDFDNNGSFDVQTETIFFNTPLVAGPNSLTFFVPENAVIDVVTYARFRLSQQGGVLPSGLVSGGEVEDYAVTATIPQDFGDAPDPTYPTLRASNGARHIRNPDIFLGNIIDIEPDGQPNLNSTGDDLNGVLIPSTVGNVVDDEDGVLFSALHAGSPSTVTVRASTSGILNAWFDFDGNGSWADAGDHVFDNVPLAGGDNALVVNVPANAKRGLVFTRFRFNLKGELSFDGPADDGEVEDHPIFIRDQQIPCEQSSKGTDFWLTFPANLAPDPDNPLKLSLSIVGPRLTTGRVEIPGLGFTNNFTIDGSMKVVVPLPKGADLGLANDVIQDNGIHVVASQNVAVFGLSRVLYTTDGFLGLPSSTLGKQYIIQSYGNVHSGVPSLNGTQFGIVACEDETTVTIRPSVDVGGHPANVSYVITLNAGQTYQLRGTNDAPQDLTGTFIQADKNVAVFGSHRCANIPDENTWFCDYIVEQLLSVERAGREFAVKSLATRSGDAYRVMATQDKTAVAINGLPAGVIDRGEFIEQILAADAYINADKPVLVTQYATSSDYDGVTDSDPFQVVVPSTDMFMDQYMVCVPDAGYKTNYLNVVIPTIAVGTVRINAAVVNPALFSPILGTGFSGAQVGVLPGVHNLDGLGGAGISSRPFSVTVYGWDEYDSYGYPGGLFFPDRTPPQISCLLTNGFLAAVDNCMAFLPDLRQLVVVTDNCSSDFGVDQFPPAQTPLPVGTNVVTMSATDVNGNTATCTITIVVVDVSQPAISCPQRLVANCDSKEGAIVSFDVPAFSGQCGTPLPVVCDPPSGSFFPTGDTLVTCTTSNMFGLTASCEFVVTVRCISVNLDLSSGDLSIAWPGGGTLQTADDPAGPWTNIIRAPNPYILQTIEPTRKKGFFRVEYPD